MNKKKGPGKIKSYFKKRFFLEETASNESWELSKLQYQRMRWLTLISLLIAGYTIYTGTQGNKALNLSQSITERAIAIGKHQYRANELNELQWNDLLQAFLAYRSAVEDTDKPEERQRLLTVTDQKFKAMQQREGEFTRLKEKIEREMADLERLTEGMAP